MIGSRDYWLFDLDNTLYPQSSGLFDAIDGRINRYLQRFFDLGPEAADTVRRDYFRKYGLTLVGLMEERAADPHHYLEYVHRVPVGDYLGPNPRLREMLEAIEAPKAIFTNGSRRHSEAVTAALGVSAAFEEIFDIASTGFIPKPDPRSYRTVLESLGVEGARTVMVEDLPRNLPPAKELGMTTILVRGGGEGRAAGADFTIGEIENLTGLLARTT